MPEKDIKSELLGRLKSLQEGEVQTDYGMETHVCQMIEVTAKDLRAAIKSNPKHPISLQWKGPTKLLPDGYKLTVEQCDLQALLENKEVIVEQERADDDGLGTVVLRKVLGDAVKDDAEAEAVETYSATADPRNPSSMTKNQVPPAAPIPHPVAGSADEAARSAAHSDPIPQAQPEPPAPENFDKVPKGKK